MLSPDTQLRKSCITRSTYMYVGITYGLWPLPCILVEKTLFLSGIWTRDLSHPKRESYPQTNKPPVSRKIQKNQIKWGVCPLVNFRVLIQSPYSKLTGFFVCRPHINIVHSLPQYVAMIISLKKHAFTRHTAQDHSGHTAQNNVHNHTHICGNHLWPLSWQAMPCILIKKTLGLSGIWTRDLSHPKRESYS